MTIRIEVTNPAEHQPSELRAVATFLNNLAADRESGRIQHTPAFRQVGTVSVASHEVPVTAAPLSDARQDTADVPGASNPTDTVEDANASGAGDTSKVDSKGVMWDERIHSETRNQNNDGTWRLRRGVDKDLVAQVLAEQNGDAPAVPADDEQAPPPPVEETEDEAPPPPADDAPSYQAKDVIKFITDNKIPADQVNAIVEGYGLKRAADLFGKPQLVDDVMAALQSMVG